MKKMLSLAALMAATLVFGTAGTATATLWDCECTLEGSQEVPPNASTATGTGSFVLDDVAGTLDYNISYSGLSSNVVGAHIHGPAPVGANAGVLFGLIPGSPIIGQWAGMSTTHTNLVATGLTYVNIHSNNFPGGEIRGQITCTPVTAVEESSWGRVKQLFR
ncbi:MAG: CHRD domain-containing protein [Gemmatimonadetes bacterium]|nr:CHRD domain-containing protein [Gemmatimonadota bacterium]